MLYYYECMPLSYQAVKRIEQHAYIVEMQTGGGFVEYEYSGLGAVVGKERCEFHTLILTARQCGRRLAEFDISQSYVFEWLQSLDYAALYGSVGLREELYGLGYSHVEYVADIFVAVFHFENFFLEALSVAYLAGYYHIGQKLHRYGYNALAFTFLAASALGVEREVHWGESHLL